MKSDPNKITDPAEMLVDTSNFAPAHPGPFVKDELKRAFRLDVSKLARAIGMNRPWLHLVLDGQKPVSRELAYKLEALTGIDADLLLGMQNLYDAFETRADRARFAREIARLQPVDGS